jgi:sporulation-control protein
MKRVLASIGIGAATVDAVLPKTDVRPGETVAVDVELHGGDSPQEIEGIHFVLKARVEADGKEYVLDEVGIDRSLSLVPDASRTIPVDVDVPLWTPITTNEVSVWLETRLVIDWARDPTDESRMTVVPDEFVAALFDALEGMGFALRGSDLDDVPHVADRPVAQTFCFQPTDDRYSAALDAIEITVMPRSGDLRMFVEYDRRDRVADEHELDFDRQEVSMTVKRASSDTIRRRLEDGIDQHT